jgi:hypothetical protein
MYGDGIWEDTDCYVFNYIDVVWKFHMGILHWSNGSRCKDMLRGKDVMERTDIRIGQVSVVIGMCKSGMTTSRKPGKQELREGKETQSVAK